MTQQLIIKKNIHNIIISNNMNEEKNNLRKFIKEEIEKQTINELQMLPIKVRLVVMSHLSDVQEMASTGDTQEIRQRINFVKYLIQKYNDLNTDIMPDDEWEQFLERFSK